MSGDDFVPSSDASGAGKVLIADDEVSTRRGLEELLGMLGYRVIAARDGDEALAAALRELPDVIVTDVRMPGLDGFELCRALRAETATRLTPIVLITGTSQIDDRLRALEAGASDFVAKPVDASELKARLRSLVQLKRFTDDLESAEAVLRSLALTIEARDASTEGHCERLARYAVELGRRLRLPDEDLQTLARGGYFHDLGKIAVPDRILLKRGPLTGAERTLMREHPIIGERLCGDLRTLHRVKPIVRHHHERLDGSGYPDGLSGDAIPLLAQIISIVDVYDAITSDRPHRAARPPEAAFVELMEEAARGWRRRDLVEAFIAERRERLASAGDALVHRPRADASRRRRRRSEKTRPTASRIRRASRSRPR